jgi:hypothetical protein
MGMLPRALEIVSEVKLKMSNVKIARKKKLSNSQKSSFSIFFSLDPSYFQSF